MRRIRWERTRRQWVSPSEGEEHASPPEFMASHELPDEATDAVDVNWEALTAREEEQLAPEFLSFDVDRMVNEGLGGGQVTQDNGYIGDSTTDALFADEQDQKG
ncbi:hypothetical protein Q5741_12485 [Paenibacillus sp. JX-17]|uniref:Uncharacterized protein n=1 Tax=Paenibacillus lacisoli TaxID=3064525 RepID=A0ABT9CHZ6_9BACL|nr:hypothetical protein [Paenibacillus sp. JX-17]MDO7907228.1 hypothetical protein [Paenibacillus sp. JX-17]